MGFRYKKINERKIMCEKNYVIRAKITFLRKYLQFQNSSENINFIFLDETWVYKNGSQVRKWVNENDKRMNDIKITSEGERFTILHAGYKGGFLPNCGLLFSSKNNDRDYHKTMNGEIFLDWVKTKLVPDLDKINGKCVVMDNAPYHSVLLEKPISKFSNKTSISAFLQKHGIYFSNELSKKELWNLAEPYVQNSSNKKYVVDEFLNSKGYEVLRLPPYHCQYNPIEMVWGYCKTFYNKNIPNSKFTGSEKVLNVWQESLSKITSDMWANYIKHTEQLIIDDWKKYMGNMDIVNVPPLIIGFENDSASDSDTDMPSENDEEYVE
ncbi:hypothetical protein ABEB36_002675 [Hypothenemus hampei]|uniref:Tc1-like transposase DDE domain-containing protein n=1 Tax=Hypothenemus hampei TaxID=57062 RepID=A0ABD1F6L8_HYPHA